VIKRRERGREGEREKEREREREREREITQAVSSTNYCDVLYARLTCEGLVYSPYKKKSLFLLHG
jgi:hypothetical protein